MSCLTEYTMKLSCHEHVEGTCLIVDLNLPDEYFFFIVCCIFINGLICYWPGNEFSNFRFYIGFIVTTDDNSSKLIARRH
jgi:hypothetical protein